MKDRLLLMTYLGVVIAVVLFILGSVAHADTLINMGKDFYVDTKTIKAESIPPPENGKFDNFEGGYYITARVYDYALGVNATATITSNPCYNRQNSYMIINVNGEHQSYERNYTTKGSGPLDQIARVMCKWTLTNLGE